MAAWILTTCLFSLLIFTQIIAEDEDYCPYQWESWQQKCLFLTAASSKSALQADKQCANHEGSLIVVNNETQNADLTAFIQLGSNDVMPLGCRNNKTDAWQCVDETSYWFNDAENAGYWAWAENQPDNGDSSCLILNQDGMWLDDNCTLKQDIVIGCERERVSSAVQCPMSWKATNNKCFGVFSEYGLKKPKNIVELCESQGGQVFTVDSKDQNQHLLEEANLSADEYLMLGCRDVNSNNGRWSCDARSSYMVHWSNETQAGYWNWNTDADEPRYNSTDGKDCVFMATDGLWVSGPCDGRIKSIIACEHAPTTVMCPDDYQPWEDRCLHIQEFNGSIDSANDACQSMEDGTLAVVESTGQNSFLGYQIRLSSVTNMPLGCTDAQKEGTWVCYGKGSEEFYWKSDKDQTGYWNWKEGYPRNDTTINCLGINEGGLFRDVPCNASSDLLLACTHGALKEPTSSPEPLPTTTRHMIEPHNGLSTGGIILIVACVLISLFLIGFLGFVYARHSSSNSNSPPLHMPGKTSINFESLDEYEDDP